MTDTMNDELVTEEMVAAGAKQMRAALNDGAWDDETVFYSALEAAGITALSSTPTVADDGKLVDEALRAIELGLQFAYENGLHEFGYDPVAVVRERIAARLEQHPNLEASK
jgi:hypothetical protein